MNYSELVLSVALIRGIMNLLWWGFFFLDVFFIDQICVQPCSLNLDLNECYVRRK